MNAVRRRSVRRARRPDRRSASLLGAFTAITFGPQVGAGIGITVGYLTWIALMAIDVTRTGIDVEALKTRFYPDPDHRHQQGDARVATETDAARDRVLAARADAGRGAGGPGGLGPRRGRHPRQDQAQPGKDGRRRRWRGVPRARRSAAGLPAPAGAPSRARPTPLPPSMLPDEIEKTLRKLGDDGDKVRGALERDFAAYAKQAQRGPAQACGRCSCCRSPRPLLHGGGEGRRRLAVQHRRRELPGAAGSRSASGPSAQVDETRAKAPSSRRRRRRANAGADGRSHARRERGRRRGRAATRRR